MTTHNHNSLRERDFIAACRGVMAEREGAITSLRELAAEVLRRPAPSYYLDIDYAYRVAQRVRRGHGSERRSSQAKWSEIMTKVAERRGRRRLSLMKALTEVLVEEGASGFFMAHSTAVRLLQRYNRRNKGGRFYFPD